MLTDHFGKRYTQYTSIWNALDYPALVIPVSKVDPSVDKKRAPHVFLGQVDKDHYEICKSGYLGMMMVYLLCWQILQKSMRMLR